MLEPDNLARAIQRRLALALALALATDSHEAAWFGCTWCSSAHTGCQHEGMV